MRLSLRRGYSEPKEEFNRRAVLQLFAHPDLSVSMGQDELQNWLAGLIVQPVSIRCELSVHQPKAIAKLIKTRSPYDLLTRHARVHRAKIRQTIPTSTNIGPAYTAAMLSKIGRLPCENHHYAKAMEPTSNGKLPCCLQQHWRLYFASSGYSGGLC